MYTLYSLWCHAGHVGESPMTLLWRHMSVITSPTTGNSTVFQPFVQVNIKENIVTAIYVAWVVAGGFPSQRGSKIFPCHDVIMIWFVPYIVPVVLDRVHIGGMRSLIARFVGPTWGPSGADRVQVGPMLAPWTLLSGMSFHNYYLLVSQQSQRAIVGWVDPEGKEDCHENIAFKAAFSYARHATRGMRQRQRHYSLHTYFFVCVQLDATSDKSPATCRPRHLESLHVAIGGATFSKSRDIVTSFALNIGL